MIDVEIPWEPWGELAFDRARRERKSVVLHIGATWCHWCHVMDEGSYPHAGVARLLRERFVPIRVDTDARPDINERYNQGGWPTFAILDGDGEVLLGRTYVPGPELYMLLSGLAESTATWTIAPPAPVIHDGVPVAVETVVAEVAKAYDRYHGGFGDYEKFPHLPVAEWLLDRWVRGVDDGARLVHTLDGMAGLGMYDQEEGGFFRYSTQDDWSVPHFEKLLDDNARLIALYLRADAHAPHPLWNRAAEAAVGWILARLWNEREQGFGGSQDADEGYYQHPRAARGTPPPVDFTVYTGWNAQMVVALVRAALVWRRPGLFGIAIRVAERLYATRVATDGCVTRAPGVEGLLEDQVQVAESYILLGRVSGDPVHYARANAVLGWARDHLGAPGGGCYDRVPVGIGRLGIARRPMTGNSAFAVVCRDLGVLTGDDGWRRVAEAAAFVARCEATEWGFMGAAAAGAFERVSAQTLVIKVNNHPELLRTLLLDPHPDRLAMATDSGDDRQSVPSGLAMVCSADACSRPSSDLGVLRLAMAALTRPG